MNRMKASKRFVLSNVVSHGKSMPHVNEYGDILIIKSCQSLCKKRKHT